jgi:flagellar biosynthetic protein FliQ
MTPEAVLTLAHQAMVVALVVGLAISLFQAATQINETTLSFIPKLLAVAVTLVIAGPWMLTTMLDYMRNVFTSIASMGG